MSEKIVWTAGSFYQMGEQVVWTVGRFYWMGEQVVWMDGCLTPNGWASHSNGWTLIFIAQAIKAFERMQTFFDHMTQVTWTNANFFQTASEWNFVWKWKAVNVCFCVKSHKFCRTIVTSHVKTDTNGYQFEWLKTVCLPFALHFLIVICSWWMWCCSNRFGHPFRKISTCLNGCCYPFK